MSQRPRGFIENWRPWPKSLALLEPCFPVSRNDPTKGAVLMSTSANPGSWAEWRRARFTTPAGRRPSRAANGQFLPPDELRGRDAS